MARVSYWGLVLSIAPDQMTEATASTARSVVLFCTEEKVVTRTILKDLKNRTMNA